MYSKQQASEIRKQFWTKVGMYMRPIHFADGAKNNWVNYKTGVRGIRFVMDAFASTAIVAVEMTGLVEQREKTFNTFSSLKDDFPEGFSWIKGAKDEHGKQLSLIKIELNGHKLMNEQDWPFLISFFKENMIKLDAFWAMYRDIFEMQQ